MATNVYIGGSPLQRNVWTLTVGGTVEAGDLFNVTLTFLDGSSSQTVQATASSTSTATTAADIRTALKASTQSSFRRIDYELSGSAVVLSAQDPGIPFDVTVTTTEAGGGGADAQTFTASETIPNGGPNDYGDPGNWSLGAIPTASDIVIISGTDSILYGLDQDAVSINGFAIDPNYPRGAQIGTLGYPLRLVLDASAPVQLAGEGRYFIDFTSSDVDVSVLFAECEKTMTSGGVERYGVGAYLIGSSLNTIYVEGGNVHVATLAGHTATVGAVIVAGGRCEAGSGVSGLATWSQGAGTGAIGCAVSTGVYVDGGHLTSRGSGAVPVLKINGGTYVGNSTGTIAEATVNAGFLDMSKSHAAREITKLVQNGGTVWKNTDAVTYPTAAHEGGSTAETPAA